MGDELAPDGLLETSTSSQCEEIASGIANHRLGIKALLLDQKRFVSGVGNWVADEVLYQCEIHPDQRNLMEEQALNVVTTLHTILKTAVDCLQQDIPYPDTWLFGYRWTRKQAGKDHKGRNLTFLKSGGRTSAIVSSRQVLAGQGKTKKAKGGNVSKTVVDQKNNAPKPKINQEKTVETSQEVDSSITSSRKRKTRSDNHAITKNPKVHNTTDQQRSREMSGPAEGSGRLESIKAIPVKESCRFKAADETPGPTEESLRNEDDVCPEYAKDSRVWIHIPNGGWWKATILSRKESKSMAGYRIHYDGYRKGKVNWVPEEQVADYI